MFLEIIHERCPSCPDGGGIARVGLMLPMNVIIGIADVNVTKLYEQIDAGAVGSPEIGTAELATATPAGPHKCSVCGARARARVLHFPRSDTRR